MASLKRIGKYEILRQLGRGAMGVVYQARDPVIGRLVALKTITSAVAEDADQLLRFQREAQAAGNLQHPNIVTIYELGTEDSVPYLVMEYLDGESLDLLIARRAPIPFLEKLSYLVQLCRALHHAHESGVVHRDVKPANVVVKKDGTIKVVDFGIARLVDTTRTQTGVILGTIGYMSPQQLHGQRADERSDIWATGVLAYELLTGKKPFSGESHAAMILDILTRTPEPLEAVAPECPPDIQAVILRAMHKEDALRYQNMGMMLAELEPLWKREQDAHVNKLLDQTQKYLEKENYPAAREQLEQVLRIDRESATAAVLLEELRCGNKGIVLQEEVRDMVERGGRLLMEGLFSDARAEAEAALRLDPKCQAARALLQEVEQIESAAHRALRDASDGAPVLEREYAFRGPGGVAMPGSSGSAPRAEARPITATARGQAGSRPRTGLSTGTIVPAAQSAQKRPIRWKRLLVLSAGVVLTGIALYLRQSWTAVPPSPSQPSVAASDSARPATANLEDRQRTLIERAYEAADHEDYASARARLDEAEGLRGPLSPRIADLRRRFSEQEHNAGLRGIAQQERQFWAQGMRALQQNRFDDADAALRSVVQLPEGGLRREDAERYLREVIPQRREEEKLFAQAQAMESRRDAVGLQEEAGLLDRIAAMNGPRRSEASRMRQQVSDRLAALSPPPKPEAPPATASLTSQPAAQPAKTNPVPPSEPMKTPDPQPVEAADASRFQSAVDRFEKASRARDLRALKEEVLPEFQKIAQGGGNKTGDAQRYVASLIPAAIREATPWPAIGCPGVPSGLEMKIKPGDLVACGLLDPPRLKWGQFVWPAFPEAASQAGQQKAVVMLSITVDENGSVLDVRPRGKTDASGFLDAAVSAARKWKTTPPRAQGKPVKTEFAVDLPFAP